MPAIHETAIVDPGAEVAETAHVGPYCVVGPGVVLGDGVVLHSHAVVEGRTWVGPRTQIFPFASIGHRPQDLKFGGESSDLIIGADNMVREHVTMNPGTEGGGMVTRVGDKCLFMIGAHVAHDCIIGDGVIMANNATLGGHVTIGDNAIIGGLAAIHQFVRIGRNAMIGGMSAVEHDVIPYGLVVGERARLHGLNVVGLKRSGFERAEIKALTAAIDLLFDDSATLSQRVDEVASAYGTARGVGDIVDFVCGESSRALCRPKAEHGGN